MESQPLGNTTSYTYDAAGRLVQETDPLGATTSYSYDLVGNLVEKTDRLGRTTQYQYDNLDRLVQELWLDQQNQAIYQASYTWDVLGRLVDASDNDSTYGFTYDNLDRVTGVDTTGTTGLGSWQLSYQYDARGLRTSAQDSAGTEVQYGYDAAGRLTSLNWLVGATSYAQVDFTYDAASRRTQAVRTDGSGASITTTYTYDNLGRITEILNTSNLTGTLSQFTYAYDAASRVTQYTGPEGTISYSYDATGQLTGATGATNETYTYDPAGNRTGSPYQTGPANRLLSDGTYNYTYDAEGNLVQKTEIATGKTWTYTWDHRNRLTHVTIQDAGGTVVTEVDYVYDIFNRLIGRIEDADGDGPGTPEETWTLYDTPDTAEAIAAAVYGPGTLVSNPWADVKNGSLESRYLYTRAVDEVFARLADDQGQLDLAWYIADRLGSIRQQVETDGTVLNEITYDSFGNILTETNPAAGDRFKFTGREYDDLTGLYYYRARWYDANTGKFISEDPLRFAAGDYNLSRYVANDPANLVDPGGLFPPLEGYLGPNGEIVPVTPFRQAPSSAKAPSLPPAKEVQKILPRFLPQLKRIAKESKKYERLGFILKSRKKNIKPRYKLVELEQANPSETTSSYDFASDGAGNKYARKPGKNGVIPAKGGKADTRYTILCVWHTHPHAGEPVPSAEDREDSSKNKLVGVMIMYMQHSVDGKLVDDWSVWIVDTDGTLIEYKGPGDPWPEER